MILENYKTIFVHIPKTAGGTVELRLGKAIYGDLWQKKRHEKMSLGGKWTQHFTYEDYINEYSVENLEGFYSFCFVRNPWDRAVSEYLYMMKMKGCVCGEKDIPSTFKTYLKEDFRCSWSSHVRPQSDYILDKNNKIVVDDVFRFEDFEAQFKIATKAMGFPGNYEFPKSKANVTRKPFDRLRRPYWKFYDRETRDIVAEKYEKDISLFGYSFV